MFSHSVFLFNNIFKIVYKPWKKLLVAINIGIAGNTPDIKSNIRILSSELVYLFYAPALYVIPIGIYNTILD